MWTEHGIDTVSIFPFFIFVYKIAYSKQPIYLSIAVLQPGTTY